MPHTMGDSRTRPGTVVLDLDGVLYLDTQGIPGAGEALGEIASMGWRLLFATNNSSKTPRTVAEHIKDRTGFDASGSPAVTSSGSAARYVARRHTTAHVVGSPAIAAMLEDAGVSVSDGVEPGAVVVGLDRGLTYDSIDRAARLIRGGSEFVATNIDSTYPTPTGLSPGAGTIVAAIREASGIEPINCGKPTPIFLSLVEEKVAGDQNVWMVGDRPDTDIAMARAGGWTSVLTLTGVTDSAEGVPDRFRPDHVIPSIAALPRLLEQSLGVRRGGG